MPIQLGPAFETAMLRLAGIDPGQVDPGTVEVSTPNPAGPTTIRCTLVVSVETEDLKQAITDALPAAP